MIFQVLDYKEVGEGKSWYLCKGKLYDFIKALHKDFYEYQIQRRIVRNVYLDGLYNTIQENSPIPPITLTASDVSVVKSKDTLNVEFSSGNVDILDGLQRTFRLWVFLDLYNKVHNNHISTYNAFVDYLKKEDESGEYILNLDFVSTGFLKKVLDEREASKLLDAYREYDMYFAIWTNLSDAEIIKKMLVLNAGQRPVSSTHQYELLFLHYFDHNKLNLPSEVRLFREKDSDYFKIRRGDRKLGQYTMTSIIIALQSYIEEEPLRVIPTNYIKLESDTEKKKRIDDFFQSAVLSDFIKDIYDIDQILVQKNKNYIKWFGKDTTLSGVFAALGHTGIDVNLFKQRVKQGDVDFRLDEFEKAYDALSSTRVNVGNVVRKAVYRYTCAEIAGTQYSWTNAFGVKEEENETW